MINQSLILDELELLPYWVQLKKQTYNASFLSNKENGGTSNNDADLTAVVGKEKIFSAAPFDETVQTSVVQDASFGNVAFCTTLQDIEKSVQCCRQCLLAGTRDKPVFGSGNPLAKWLFVGEAPGENEDRLGLPFVGMAGKLLDNMLLALGMNRMDDVYITNIIKCRPPENRDPFVEEIIACEAYLEKQIDLIRPNIITALGRVAAQSLLKTNETVSKLRLREHFYKGIPVVVTYHPAYLLRNAREKRKAWDDLLYGREFFLKNKKLKIPF